MYFFRHADIYGHLGHSFLSWGTGYGPDSLRSPIRGLIRSLRHAGFKARYGKMGQKKRDAPQVCLGESLRYIIAHVYVVSRGDGTRAIAV